LDIHLEEVRPLSKPVSKRAVVSEVSLQTESLKKSPFVSHQQSKALFFSGLSRLLGGGVPVLRALSLVSSYQMRDEKFRIVVSRMAASVREGRMLSPWFLRDV
jgi:type II secretory pathway component PulF